MATLKQFLTLGMGFNPKQGVIRKGFFRFRTPIFGRGSEKETRKIVNKFFLPREQLTVMSNLVSKTGYLYFESTKHAEKFFAALEKIGWDTEDKSEHLGHDFLLIGKIYYDLAEYSHMCTNSTCLRPYDNWEVEEYGQSCQRCGSVIDKIKSKKVLKYAEAEAKQAA